MREAIQTFGLLVVAGAGAAAVKALIDPGAPGLPPPLAGATAGGALASLLAALLALLAAFPAYPARRVGWPREVLPLAIAAAAALPGGIVSRHWPAPSWSLLLIVSLVAVVWRHDWRAGPRRIAAAARAALPGRGWRLAVVGAGALLLVALFSIQLGEMDRVATRVTDFRTFLDAAAALAGGGDPYRDVAGYMYPPSFAFWIRPLLWFEPSAASLLWFVVKLSLVTWTFTLADRLLHGTELPATRRAWFRLGLVMVAARFWITDLQFGNTNDLLLFLTTGALAWAAGRPTKAGACLALAITIKAVPILIAGHFVVARRWRALAWTAVWALALNVIPLAVAPAPLARAWASYREVQVVGAVTERRAQPDNQSLWGAFARELPVDAAGLRLAWLAAAAALTLGVAAVTWHARRRGPLAEAAAAGLWPPLVLLVSPGSWVVHYTGMLLPLAAWLRLLLARERPPRFAWTLFALANLILTASGWWRWSIRLAADRSLFVGAALVVQVVLAWSILRRSTVSSPR